MSRPFYLSIKRGRLYYTNPYKPFNGQIQYISDIHLDRNSFRNYLVEPIHWRKKDVLTRARYLVVAGDLGNPFCPSMRSFFQYNISNWEKIFYVPGNHEYYDHSKILKSQGLLDPNEIDRIGTYEGSQEKLREIEAEFPNLEILMKNRSSIDFGESLGKVTVLGCTMWSMIPKEHHNVFSKIFSDYYRTRMRDTGKFITPEITSNIHVEEVNWLANEIQKSQEDNSKVLVITHHAPMVQGTCNQRFLPLKNDGNIDRVKYANYAFSTDLEYLLKSPVVAWIFGHTHYRVCFQNKYGVILAQNHLGYTKMPYQIPRVL